MKLILIPLALVATTIAHGQSPSLTDEELDHRVNIRRDGPVSNRHVVTVREMLQMPLYRTILPHAYQIHDFMRATFPGLMVPTTYTLPDNPHALPGTRPSSSFTDRSQLREVTESAKSQTVRFGFCDRYVLTYSLETFKVRSMQGKTSLSPTNAPTLPNEHFFATVTGLAELTRAVLPGYDYRSRITNGQTDDEDVSVSYEACLPGTTIKVGPGVSGTLNKRTGLPTFLGFVTSVQPYEPPFRSLITEQEAYGMAIAQGYGEIEWPAFRVVVQTPRLLSPEYKNPIIRSARHRELIAAQKRCLITTVLLAPATEPQDLKWFYSVSIDSQTREVLSTGLVDWRGRAGAPMTQPITVHLKLDQSISLPSLRQSVPLNPARGVKRDQKLLAVVVRQDDVCFKALLDRKDRVLWVEGKAYRCPKTFADALEKIFAAAPSPRPTVLAK